jgi:hypothetical protein
MSMILVNLVGLLLIGVIIWGSGPTAPGPEATRKSAGSPSRSPDRVFHTIFKG